MVTMIDWSHIVTVMLALLGWLLFSAVVVVTYAVVRSYLRWRAEQRGEPLTWRDGSRRRIDSPPRNDDARGDWFALLAYLAVVGTGLVLVFWGWIN